MRNLSPALSLSLTSHLLHNRNMLRLVCLCFAAFAVTQATQSVAAEGIVVCNGIPYKDAKIKIYERDPIHDDELARAYSDSNGHFKLGGSQGEFLGITAHVNIYHKCQMPFWKKVIPTCYYKKRFDVPKTYLSTGTIAQNVWNMQTIELSLYRENTDCINR